MRFTARCLVARLLNLHWKALTFSRSNGTGLFKLHRFLYLQSNYSKLSPLYVMLFREPVEFSVMHINRKWRSDPRSKENIKKD